MPKKKSKNMFRDYPDALTLRQLADMFGISTKLAAKMIKNGDIEAVKLGREYRIAKVNAIKFLLGEQNEKKCVLSENSNPKCWTSDTFCGSVVADQGTTEKEVV